MRSRLVAAAIGILAVSCTTQQPPQADDPTGPSDAVLASRELLGDPLVEVGESVLALAGGLRDARHETARGPAMRAALPEVADDISEVRAATSAALAAADQAPLADAAAIVRGAAIAAGEGADAAQQELRFLRRVANVDAGLLAAAAAWDQPGSQSEIRARLTEVADDVRGLRRRIRRLKPVPPDCPALVRNRREWAGTVRRRTERLQEHANSAGGRMFDELRASYRRLPFGVEPRTADSADVPCWQDRSPVAAAEDTVRDAVDELRDALS